jgi:uncharacterized membrane protein required for colicin V production
MTIAKTDSHRDLIKQVNEWCQEMVGTSPAEIALKAFLVFRVHNSCVATCLCTNMSNFASKLVAWVGTGAYQRTGGIILDFSIGCGNHVTWLASATHAPERPHRLTGC